MHFSNDEYKKLMKKFLNDHHGQFIKLKNDSGKIFSYIIRCESKKNTKDLITFAISFDLFYLNPITKKFPNNKEFKYYIIKRVMEKWKKIKKDKYVKYKDCLTDEFYNQLLSEITLVKNMYTEVGINCEFNEKNTVDYIFKVLKSIKNYYKNENIDDINLILL